MNRTAISASWVGSTPLRALAGALFVAAAMGCSTPTKQLKTPHYVLNHPDYWQIKQVAQKEGDATIVMIGQFGTAVIDDGSGAIEQKEANYEAVQEDIEARLYGWKEGAETKEIKEPAEAVAQRLAGDKDLQLERHRVIADQPFECDLFKKKYKIFGAQQAVVDLVSRPGWRTIVAGARSDGALVGVVARVEFQQDGMRYCHNLSNLQTQLQNLLDGLVAVPGGGGAGGGAAAGGTSGAGPPPAPPAAPGEGAGGGGAGEAGGGTAPGAGAPQGAGAGQP
jgi:hypothetical protein